MQMSQPAIGRYRLQISGQTLELGYAGIRPKIRPPSSPR
jgi:hypothetical protein